MKPAFRLRPAAPTDVESHQKIQLSAYTPEFLEARATFLDRVRAYPAGCFIAELGPDSVAYLISHPWRRRSPPELDIAAFVVPAGSDSYYIHSVTVMKHCQHQGIGEALARKALAVGAAAGFRNFSLVSVQDSMPFWRRFGFSPCNDQSAGLRAKVAVYGPTACYMELQQSA